MDVKIKKLSTKKDATTVTDEIKLKMLIVTLVLIAVIGFVFGFMTKNTAEDLFYDLKTPAFIMRGRYLKHGEYFEGIQYATNTLFSRPTLKPAVGLLTATNAIDFCKHDNDTASSPDLRYRLNACLYLNVYRCGASRRPSNDQVLVYVGAGHAGSSGAGDLVPEVVIKKYACEGFIVVGVNYRQGAFGFFSTGDSSRSNNAVYDVKVALEWVQTTIKEFGGNPGNVTVLGASTGARIVSLLARSPESKGLLHQLILTPGSSFAPFSIRSFAAGQWASKWFAAKLNCSDAETWTNVQNASVSDEVYNCLEDANITTLSSTDQKAGSKDLVQWPFILDEELVRSELIESKGSVGQSVPTLFIVCPESELVNGKRYRKNHVKKILNIVDELRMKQFDWLADYYTNEMSDPKASKKMPGKWLQYQFIHRVQVNYEAVGASLLEAQSTASNDVLTYYIHVSNRKKNEKFTSLTPICLGEDIFDGSKPMRKQTLDWVDGYGDFMRDVILNFVRNADPTPANSPFLWPWYDPYSPEAIIVDAANLDLKIRPIQKLESAEFWLCQGGARYIVNATLPRFCSATNN